MYSPSFYQKIISLLIITIWPKAVSYNIAPYFVLWNVGQGQFLTRIDSFYCLHIDAGGENYPRSLNIDCISQQHRHWISHWDYDHYSFVKDLKWKYQSVQTNLRQYTVYEGERGRKKNDSSKVIQIRNLLVSGDSLKRQEKLWLQRIRLPLDIYILGHHGSKTSNSDDLLNKISPYLKQCLNSARKQKYGHPHAVVTKRLEKHKCPLIGTQNWGHIRFRLR